MNTTTRNAGAFARSIRNALAASLALGLAAPAGAELRITEICPKTAEVYDANGLESGWVELYNDGDAAVDLADYELQRFNLGKKASADKYARLPHVSLAAGGRFVVYTSDEYPNSEDEGGDGFTVATYGNGYVVVPFKVNPKKFPIVRLLKGAEVLQTEYVPVDLVPGYSYCGRTILPHPTKGAANDMTDAIAYGPNAGPLFGIKHSLSVFDPLPRPVAGEPYEVKLPVNPYLGPAIESVTLHYHGGFDTAHEKTVAMAKGANDTKGAGQWWTATIPAADIPAPGRMLRYYVTIREEGNATDWRSPSFLNPDDGFQYFGTVVAGGDLDDPHPQMQTFHLFAEGNNLAQMDVDADAQNKSLVPYNARCAVFDAQTGHFYDNVRIDLRGNTSGGFRKKSHGLRFAKCHELVCTNPFDGATIETRKTSFIAEYCDPAYIRQSLAFYTFRAAGCRVPFDYPVRLNLNGAFYQLAFHSDRFSDKLIEDHYGLDKKGYGYKNSGCLHWDGSRLVNWVACEKKTPDDGDEGDLTELKRWVKSFNAGMQPNVDDQAAVTKKVVETFDLPAWLNYLAESRITMECDDTWANLSTYWDRRGTGTWMPLGYDMNQSWGHIYYGQYGGAKSIVYADRDDHKAHPFFGGRRVICHYANGSVSHPGSENWAIEAIWQSTKFRRLYLRRLRTLMDEQLKAPGTPKEETPFWRDYVVAVTNATRACAALDYAKWRADKATASGSGTFWTESPTYCWSGPLTHDQGIADLWDSYIVPRRRHLYDTHSVTNKAWAVGYAQNLNAGIPRAQRDLAALKPRLSFAAVGDSVLEIANANGEAVDLSGWRLRGRVDWTLPAGCVVDAYDSVYIVADRQASVAATALTDQVIVGNAPFHPAVDGARLETADGTEVVNTLGASIVRVTENALQGTATLVADVRSVAAAYGLDLTKDADRAKITLDVTPSGGATVAATIGADGQARVSWPNGKKTLARQVVLEVRIDGTGTVAGGGTVVLLSEWRWYFRAMEDAGGVWTKETADPDKPVSTFTLDAPADSAGKVVIVEIEAAWPFVEEVADEHDAGSQTGLARTAEGFCALVGGEWTKLTTDAPAFDGEETVVTLIELDYLRGTVRYWLCRDGNAYALVDADGNDRLALAFPPAGERKLTDVCILGPGSFARLDGRLLSRTGDEPAGFLLRLR